MISSFSPLHLLIIILEVKYHTCRVNIEAGADLALGSVLTGDIMAHVYLPATGHYCLFSSAELYCLVIVT